MPWSKQGTLSGTGGGVPGGGSWRLSDTAQAFWQGSTARIRMNTELRAPVGITNRGDGSWTINQTGWWDFSGLCDLAMTADFYQEWMIAIRNYTQDQTLAADQFFWVKDAYTLGNAAGSYYCNTGDIVEFTGVFYVDIGGIRAYSPVSTARSGFTALYRGD